MQLLPSLDVLMYLIQPCSVLRFGHQLYRNGAALYRSPPMVHEFNLPVQLGTGSSGMARVFLLFLLEFSALFVAPVGNVERLTVVRHWCLEQTPRIVRSCGMWTPQREICYSCACHFRVGLCYSYLLYCYSCLWLPQLKLRQMSCVSRHTCV